MMIAATVAELEDAGCYDWLGFWYPKPRPPKGYLSSIVNIYEEVT